MRLYSIASTAILVLALSLLACGNTTPEPQGEAEMAATDADMLPVDVVAEEPQPMGDSSKPGHIVISKEDMNLRLFDVDGLLICEFDVATGKNVGNKRRRGDMKTPEGEFTIQMIQPSSSWTHNFGDGKGEIAGCYGPWFIRLSTPPHTGIGIHGTHLPESIGTRATEGCVRLHNDDLDSLKRMVRVGMKVVIESAYEDRAEDARLDGKPIPERPMRESDVVEPVKVESAVSVLDAKPVEMRWEPAADKQVEPVVEVVAPAVEVAALQESAVAETEVETPQPAAQPMQPTETTTEVYHTIADGELVGALAIKYGTTVSKLKELNPTLNPDRVSIGQVIRVK